MLPTRHVTCPLSLLLTVTLLFGFVKPMLPGPAAYGDQSAMPRGVSTADDPSAVAQLFMQYELALDQLARARTSTDLARGRDRVGQLWPEIHRAGITLREKLAVQNDATRLAEYDHRLAAVAEANTELARLDAADIGQARALLPRLHTGGGEDARASPILRLPGQTQAPPQPVGRAGAVSQERLSRLTTLRLAAPRASRDLAATIDAQIAPEIQALADQLAGDPVAIYAYVRNHIAYQPYYGSRKGSLLTLWEGSGNDADTASLLVALLRASGFPAKYMHGTVALNATAAENWVGNAPDLATAAAILSAGGVHVSISENNLLLVDHIWVAVVPTRTVPIFLPLVTSTAARDTLSSRLSATPPTDWVLLDPSFKQFTYHTPTVELSSITQFDAEAWLTAARAGTRLDDARRIVYSLPRERQAKIQNDDRPFADARLTQAISATQAYGEANLDLTLGEVLGGRTIITQTFTTLPRALPYPVVDEAKIVSYSELPDSLRHYLVIEVQRSNGATDLSYRTPVTQLANQRVTIIYEAASAQDQAIIDSHDGVLIKTPPVVALTPVLRVGGVEVARGDRALADTMGYFQNWQLVFERPGGQQVTVSNTLTVGDTATVVLDVGRSSLQAVQATEARFNAARTAIPADSNGHPDSSAPQNMAEPVIGEMLYLAGQAYFSQMDAYAELIARGQNVRWFRHFSGGVVTQPVVIQYAFGLPVATLGGGLGMDIPQNTLAAVSLAGDPDAVVRFRLAFGFVGSVLEEEIWRGVGQRAVSTVGMLSRALAHGIPVHSIDASNREQIADLLLMPGDVDVITKAVDAGMRVLVPGKTAIAGWTGGIGDWLGTGYIILDPASGESSFIISGGLAGNGALSYGGSIADILKTVAAFAWLVLGFGLGYYVLIDGVLSLVFDSASLTLAGILWASRSLLYAAISIAMNVASFLKLAKDPHKVDQYLADQLVGLFLSGVLKRIGVRAAAGLIGSLTSGNVRKYVESLATATEGASQQLLQRGFSQEEVANLSLITTEPSDWQAVVRFTDQYGLATARVLLANRFLAEQGALGTVARTSVDAPNAPGRAEMVAKAAGETGFGYAYALQQAAFSQSAGDTVLEYRIQTTVVYTEVIGLDGQEQPIFGQPAVGDLEADYVTGNPRIWHNVTHGPCLDEADLVRWNQVAMADSAGGDNDDDGLFIYMFSFSQLTCPITEDWVIRNTSWVAFLAQQGNSFP